MWHQDSVPSMSHCMTPWIIRTAARAASAIQVLILERPCVLRVWRTTCSRIPALRREESKGLKGRGHGVWLQPRTLRFVGFTGTPLPGPENPKITTDGLPSDWKKVGKKVGGLNADLSFSLEEPTIFNDRRVREGDIDFDIAETRRRQGEDAK